jgi:hypothetical protein
MQPGDGVVWTFRESEGRGIDVDLGSGWHGFNETFADSVSTLPPRGWRRRGLSAYWIDALSAALEKPPGPGRALVWGDTTELLLDGQEVVASSLYDTFEAERLPISTVQAILADWRIQVRRRRRDFTFPQTYRRNPIDK